MPENDSNDFLGHKLFTDIWKIRIISLNVESGILQLRPDYSEEEHHRIFGGISNPKIVLAMAAVFSIVYAPPRITSLTGPYTLVSDVVLLPIDFIVVSAALWVYLRSLWGVYKFGLGPLRLVPYNKDRMLGLHPIGSMTLSFGIVYLLLDTLALAAGVITGPIRARLSLSQLGMLSKRVLNNLEI